jgi:hypothetical protein
MNHPMNERALCERMGDEYGIDGRGTYRAHRVGVYRDNEDYHRDVPDSVCFQVFRRRLIPA